jgi:hypothetical protein
VRGMSCYKSAVYIHSPLTRYVAPATSLVRCFAGQVRRPRDPLFFVLCSGYALVMLWLCSGYRAVVVLRGGAPIGLSNVVPVAGGGTPPPLGGGTPLDQLKLESRIYCEEVEYDT